MPCVGYPFFLGPDVHGCGYPHVNRSSLVTRRCVDSNIVSLITTCYLDTYAVCKAFNVIKMRFTWHMDPLHKWYSTISKLDS